MAKEVFKEEFGEILIETLQAMQKGIFEFSCERIEGLSPQNTSVYKILTEFVDDWLEDCEIIYIGDDEEEEDE